MIQVNEHVAFNKVTKVTIRILQRNNAAQLKSRKNKHSC